jgi:hypothetical protein
MLQYVDCAHNWKDEGLSGDYCKLMTDMGLENLMPGTSAFMANITQILCRGPFCPVLPSRQPGADWLKFRLHKSQKAITICECKGVQYTVPAQPNLKVHKIENFFDFDFGICVISLLAMSKY